MIAKKQTVQFRVHCHSQYQGVYCNRKVPVKGGDRVTQNQKYHEIVSLNTHFITYFVILIHVLYLKTFETLPVLFSRAPEAKVEKFLRNDRYSQKLKGDVEPHIRLFSASDYALFFSLSVSLSFLFVSYSGKASKYSV